ncbi:hypothetical protein ACFWNQ_37685 [Streptomyces virginiae]|uniref:hypothetical protein n=1 Tax=Streptomyces virginiae TaxID=1961 RepID=UPI003662A0E1
MRTGRIRNLLFSARADFQGRDPGLAHASLPGTTGLSDFRIVRKLGETEYDISPYRFEIQHRHVFHLELTEPTPPVREDGSGPTAAAPRRNG